MLETKAKFVKDQLRDNIPNFKVGDTVNVVHRVQEGDKERSVGFAGLVIARTHGSGIDATFTVRRTGSGVGVERIFPLHSPIIDKIERIKHLKVRRAKLYYLRREIDRKRRRFVTKQEYAPVIDKPEVAEVAAETAPIQADTPATKEA